MDETKVNYWIDVGLLIAFLGVTVTGILKLHAVMGWLGWAWQDPLVQTMSTIHDWSGIVLAALVLVHLIVHHDWIKCVTQDICTKEEK